MRVVQQDRFGDPSVLYVTERAIPAPPSLAVLVRVHAAGINPVDWQTRAGHGVAGRIGPLPVTVGWDVSGEVVRTGQGVTGVHPGDEVFGLLRFPTEAAAYAEYTIAPVTQIARKPPELDHVHAAALPLAGLTAWQALTEKARIRPGHRVLVHAAAGGVGHLAVQIAKALGAEVIGTASAAKHDFVRALGADHVIDYATTRFETVVSDLDAVIELAGGDNAARSLPTLRHGGVLVDVAHGAPRGLGSWTGVKVTTMLVRPDGKGLRALAELVKRGRLRTEIDSVFDLTDVGAAHARGEQRGTTGKLVLRCV